MKWIKKKKTMPREPNGVPLHALPIIQFFVACASPRLPRSADSGNRRTRGPLEKSMGSGEGGQGCLFLKGVKDVQ